jgi:hypothetical protein
VLKSVVESHPDAHLSILIVWIKMYAAETYDLAKGAAQRFREDPRVVQFYDPEKLLGLAVAESLGAPEGEVAWDFYLLYDRDSTWSERAPLPIEWAHQLQWSDWADSDHLHRGDDLMSRLAEIAENYL